MSTKYQKHVKNGSTIVKHWSWSNIVKQLPKHVKQWSTLVKKWSKNHKTWSTSCQNGQTISYQTLKQLTDFTRTKNVMRGNLFNRIIHDLGFIHTIAEEKNN